MKLKEFDITLDIKKRYKNRSIEIAQNDIETNVLNIKLDNYNIGDSDIEIAFKKPDGSVVIQDNVNIIDGKIRCILDRDVISIPGRVSGEVRIIDDEFLLTSPQFEFYVRQVIKWN